MTKGDLALEHETRRMIYNHIIAHPGVSFNILKTVFGLNDSTLRYHLYYLEKSEQISPSLDDGKRLYFPHQTKRIVIRPDEEITSTFELTPTQEHIIETIKRHPGITQKDLIRVTGIKRLTLTNNLKKLMDLCVVRQIPNERNVCYEYIENDQLKFEIMKRLVIKLLKKEISEQRFLELTRKLD